MVTMITKKRKFTQNSLPAKKKKSHAENSELICIQNQLAGFSTTQILTEKSF